MNMHIKNLIRGIILFLVTTNASAFDCSDPSGGYIGIAGSDYEKVRTVSDRVIANLNKYFGYDYSYETECLIGSGRIRIVYTQPGGRSSFSLVEGINPCLAPNERQPDGRCVTPPQPIEKEKKKGKPDCEIGNPCDPSSGNKYESATDYRGSGLSFTRSYNSLNPVDGDLGFGWSGNRYKRLEFSGTDNVTIHHADGKGEPFSKSNGAWAGDGDTDLILIESGTNFTIERSDGSTEQYDGSGKLVSETNRNGQVTSYSYNGAGKLITLTGPYGHTLQFIYDTAGHLSSLTDPSGQVVTYAYDGQNNLSTVSYPDGGQRIYHYENATYPHHLTGITDENGDRYSTFAYDSDGLAIFTGHAQTDNGDYQEGFTLEYDNGSVQ